jgi:hypothetical protein
MMTMTMTSAWVLERKERGSWDAPGVQQRVAPYAFCHRRGTDSNTATRYPPRTPLYTGP